MDGEEIEVRDENNLTSCNISAASRRPCEKSSYFGLLRLVDRFKFRASRAYHGAVTVASSSFLFLVVATCAYMFFLPGFHRPTEIETRSLQLPRSNGVTGSCNLFLGKWVRDQAYPLYNASSCPFAERGFDCLGNGRRDGAYAGFRWKPRDCDIPRFDAGTMLGYLRGKRVVFVGDSLSRTQWESFVCMLMIGVKDVGTVREVRGNKITKKIRFLGISFSSYDLRIDFYRSVFLVRSGPITRRAPKRVKWTLRLDQMDDISKEWVDSDVLVFNTGHWWNPNKLFEMGCYFQVGKLLKLGMPITSALEMALRTWASWVDTHIDRNRTTVFIRTFESSHWRSGHGQTSCKVTRNPLSKIEGKGRSFISDATLRVVKNMTAPVIPLHVTEMGAYRSDAHVGQWGDDPTVPDCSHWCLPGVPDVWNEILFSLLPRNRNA
ncbi:hypothetical protein MLD38_000447 [Melastoma candidum]|uniref:Uncharacterized protein n=1 Tax=Melastoma candidum TaxID=119954 RepID=A0ACB9SBD0_9MYRT|nr:hypothetical protein MLD38_000447 [Melastoma candidum]